MKISKNVFLPFLILYILFFIGCEKQPDITALKTEVNSINDMMEEAIISNNYDNLLKLYTQDAISLPSYQPMLKGLEAIKSNSDSQTDMQGKMKEFVITSTDVWVSGNFVVDIGTYSMTLELPDSNKTEMKDHGKYLTLFEIQKNGSLLMKADTWNTDLNPWEQMGKQ